MLRVEHVVGNGESSYEYRYVYLLKYIIMGCYLLINEDE